MLTVLLITFTPLDYIVASSYGTKASITFVEPEENESDKTEAEDIPGGDLVDNQEEVIDSSNRASLAGSTLPKTATNNYLLLLLSIVIVFLGVFFFIYSNHKKKQSEIKKSPSLS